MFRLSSLTLLLAALSPAATKLGQPLGPGQPLAVSQVLASPDKHIGKVVQVRGKVTEVCTMAGCWMALVEPGTDRVLRVKVNDGEIVFPKEAVGRLAVAEGKLEKLTLTRAQAVARAKHEAEERGQPFDASTITAGATVYQLRGLGAVVEE